MSEDEELKLPPLPTSEKEESEEAKEIEEIKPEPKTQQTGFVWTPEIIKDLEKFLTDFLGKNLVEKYLALKSSDAEARKSYFETVSRHNRNMVYVLIVFLSIIVAFMSFLTFFGPVSGDALLFLIGTITGYVLLFVQRLVFPSKEPPPTKEE